ncbi:expressed protein [Sporolactobacillus inulinus]|uniref:Expressed protein n=1 Tax=Sporolactobacillus inulinus TaxID=2078 RepID=A0A4Y1ZAX2_9BACL|nr:glycosyltransferase [Sporolactobacillus inulinus]GAY76207.1 expressed protein [Sporolactobacillus inulinus]
MVRYKYGIIVIAYNRLESIKRLLTQLNKCDYRKEDVSLIISIDNNRSEKVIEYCRNYKWLHGNKTVITYPKRLGLRNHVLKCGDYINKYSLDAVAVFEDDVFPSIGFYQYMVQAVDFYYNDVDVAGISLYSHQINVNANLNFIPSIVNSDVYFMQFAQSWGQIWMKNQWKDFIEWYKKKVQCSDSIINEDIPTFVANWPETSWLKYHIQYCIENNKYFVYPYHALTSCFSDVGEHTNEKNTNFQVPLYEGVKLNYKFITLHDEKSIKYDAFLKEWGWKDI